jgi:hypothetical protein
MDVSHGYVLRQPNDARGGAAHRVLIEPSLDDPCAALYARA